MKKIIYSEPVELKSIKAVVLGHAVGDALGVPVEFCTRGELDADPVTDMRGWGTYAVPEGSWSDDTSMALATLDSLKQGKLDYDDIMQRFVRWYTLGEYTPTGAVFDIGGACRIAIQKYTEGVRPAPLCGGVGESSNGNGSLMRIHPIALYLFSEGKADVSGIEIIHNASALTHAHPRSEIACGIYSLILWELLRNPCKGSVVLGMRRAKDIYGVKAPLKNDSFCKEFSLYEKNLISRIGESSGSVAREEIKSTGYVVDTLEAAVWCLLTTDSYKDCVLKAVNLGEDTDTVAAIAGGLAGALYGLDSIPEEWLGALKRREYVEKMCEDAAKSWKK